MVDEPRGVFMYRSSIVLGLSVSGFFHGLLLTILGSWSDFHNGQTAGCVYVSVINTRNFGRFWPFHGLLLTDFGTLSDFHD